MKNCFQLRGGRSRLDTNNGFCRVHFKFTPAPRHVKLMLFKTPTEHNFNCEIMEKSLRLNEWKQSRHTFVLAWANG